MRDISVGDIKDSNIPAELAQQCIKEGIITPNLLSDMYDVISSVGGIAITDETVAVIYGRYRHNESSFLNIVKNSQLNSKLLRKFIDIVNDSPTKEVVEDCTEIKDKEPTVDKELYEDMVDFIYYRIPNSLQTDDKMESVSDYLKSLKGGM